MCLKPALCNAHCVNLRKVLFGQVLRGVGGNIAADVFQCGFHGFFLLFWWWCASHLCDLPCGIIISHLCDFVKGKTVAQATKRHKNVTLYKAACVCPYLLSFGHVPRHPVPCTVSICHARSVLYRVQTGAACPASGVVPALVLTRPALLPVSAGRPGALEGAGGHRRGIQPPPSPARSVPSPPKK